MASERAVPGCFFRWCLTLLALVLLFPWGADAGVLSEGFEDGTTGAWQVRTVGVSGVDYGLDYAATSAHSGEWVFRAGPSGCSADCSGDNEHGVYLESAVNRYVESVSFWIREVNLSGSSQGPEFGESVWVEVDGDMVEVLYASPFYPQVLNTWYQVVVPIGRPVVSLGIFLRDLTNSGYLLIDDIEVRYERSQVAPGELHGMALTNDGRLLVWGRNVEGQLGLGSEVSNQCSPVELGDGDWDYIAAGGWHSLGIKKDGSLWAWGHNTYGQLGLGFFGDDVSIDRFLPQQVGTSTDWAFVAASAYHSLAIKKDGSLWAWGYNYYCQLGLTTDPGDPSQGSKNEPQRVGTATDWGMVDASHYSTIALKLDGTLWGWGIAKERLGQGSTGSAVAAMPVLIGAEEEWNWASIGDEHGVGVKRDGTLWSWGLNDALGLGASVETAPEPMQIGGDTDWTWALAGDGKGMALKDDGQLYCWGSNYYGQLGLNLGRNNFHYIPILAPNLWQALAGKYDFTLGIRSGGVLKAFGDNEYCTLGQGEDGPSDTSQHLTVSEHPVGAWVDVAAGRYHSLGIREEGNLKGGTLWTWGYNNHGQLGNGEQGGEVLKPCRIGSDVDWVKVGAGDYSSLGLKSSGTLMGWGSNSNGAVAQAQEVTDQLVPASIGSSSDWVDISGRHNSGLGIKEDHSLWGWGSNLFDQLVYDGADSYYSPVLVDDGHDWESVRCVEQYSFGLDDSDALWTWGTDATGGMGLGGTLGERYPVTQVTALSTVDTVAAGPSHSLMIRSGALYACGQNDLYQLGSSTLGTTTTPTLIGALRNTWTSIAGGARHSLGVKEDGGLWSWGLNSSGQCGQGEVITEIQEPTQVLIAGGGDVSWSRVVASPNTFSLGITADGQLWSWGSNNHGQLGLGDTTNRYTPQQLKDATPLTSVFLLLLNGGDGGD